MGWLSGRFVSSGLLVAEQTPHAILGIRPALFGSVACPHDRHVLCGGHFFWLGVGCMAATYC